MKKIFPYIYIIVGISFIIKGLNAFFAEYDIYYLIFSLKTESKYIYILFNLFFGGLILFNGIGRLKNLKK